MGKAVLVKLQHTGLKSYQPFDFQQNVSETTHIHFKCTANIHAFLVGYWKLCSPNILNCMFMYC